MKGPIVNAHNAISATASSSEIWLNGADGALVEVIISGTGTWNVSIQGSTAQLGPYSDIYDNSDSQLTTGNITGNRIKLFVALTDWIKVVATEVADGATCTVNVIPVYI